MKKKDIYKIILTTSISTGVGFIYKRFFYKKDGFNGFNRDKEGFDRNGFDKEGYNREGYNKDGFNISGYDKDGYNHEGYNRFGFNREGYNKLGYDKDGFNREKRDKFGYDIYGYDRNGVNKLGFYKDGYNASGMDIGKQTREYYNGECKKIEEHLNKSKARMNSNELEYASLDIRLGLEIGVRCIITHWEGDCSSEKFQHKIITCREKDLIPNVLCDRLKEAYKICSKGQHDNEAVITSKKVYFAYKVLKELYTEVEKL